MKIFDREKKKVMMELSKKLETLESIRFPRQAVKDQILELELLLSDLNPFLGPKQEEKFNLRMERDLK